MNLELRDISKTFMAEKGESVESLSNINLTVKNEEFVCLLGPSGCGKTTLLRIIAGLDYPSTGTVMLGGTVIDRPNPQLAMIFQEYSLYPWKTVVNNIAFGLEIRGIPQWKRSEIVKKYLEIVGLEGFENSYPYELSGGMRQRVAVARALAVDPTILLMDEPFGALDAQTRNMLQHELLNIWEKTKKTILFVTHSVDEAVFLADRIVVLTPRPGTICEVIPIDQPRPRDRTSVEFAKVRRYVLDMINQPKCTLQ
jgi:NitT/TauT family transport system ATP-binding protein